MENTKTKIVSVANQKGGVAKTTSAFNIAAILAQREKRVLMIDLDPQSSLSVSCMKYEYDPDDITITELMSSIINKKTVDFKTAVHHNEPNNIDYIPATITLSGIEVDNIAAILAQREKRVLMIDLDPQSSLSVSCMKYEYDPDDITITELMSSIINKKTVDFKTAVHHNEPNNIDYIPATITLSGIEVDLCRTRCCEMVLKRVLSNYIGCYDYIIIDCPPSLSNLLYNALSAADMVLIPVLAQEMALSGIPLLLDSIDDIHEYANPDLEILGVFATWTEKNNTMSAEVIDSIKAAFNDKYLGSISKSKAAQDSSREGIALCNYKISSTNKYKNMLADEYRVIADKIECVTVTH